MANIRKLVPPIGTKGLYKLDPPFNDLIRESEVYECAAIRYFTDLENNGRNVYKLYYEPYNVPESKFREDRLDGQVLITLISPKYPPAYVPSSFIRSFPSLDSKGYNQVILTASLGPLPDDVILEPTIQAMQNAISDYIGVDVTVHTGIVPLSTAVTPEEHETREAARLGSIGTNETDYSRLVDVQNRNQSLQQKIVLLEQIIRDNGLLD